MPVKRLPERNILPWQETHDSNSVQVSFTLKNYLEFCWLWFLGTFSAMMIIRGCTVGGWAQLKLTASLTLITSSVKKKNGAFSSVGSTCVTPPELQLVGLKDLINPSPISHRPLWQNPSNSLVFPLHSPTRTRNGEREEPRKPGRKAGEPRQGAEMLILDLKAMQRRKRSPPPPTSGTESMSCACVETRPRASVGVPAGEWLCCTRSGRLM